MTRKKHGVAVDGESVTLLEPCRTKRYQSFFSLSFLFPCCFAPSAACYATRLRPSFRFWSTSLRIRWPLLRTPAGVVPSRFIAGLNLHVFQDMQVLPRPNIGVPAVVQQRRPFSRRTQLIHQSSSDLFDADWKSANASSLTRPPLPALLINFFADTPAPRSPTCTVPAGPQ